MSLVAGETAQLLNNGEQAAEAPQPPEVAERQESAKLDKILDKIENKAEVDMQDVQKKLEKLKAKDVQKIIDKKEELSTSQT